MSLSSQIQDDYISAYKAKNALRLGVLRLLKSSIKNRQVELLREPTEEEIFDLVLRAIKQRQDSIEQYSNANRDDLAKHEADELEILKEYLPQQLSDAEVEELVVKSIAEVGAASMKDMGKVMTPVMVACKGRADAKFVSTLVREKLQALSA